MVVEDDPVNQKVILMTLKNLGYPTGAVMNGEEAINILKSEKFDVILMDIQMPIMDGYEATRRIRKNQVTKDIPVIAVTAYALKGDREKALGAGCNDYMSKPITPVNFQR